MRPTTTSPRLRSFRRRPLTRSTAAIYDVALGTAIGGTFDLTVDGVVTTISWNATAADVEAALLANAITATVTGTWHIVFSVADDRRC